MDCSRQLQCSLQQLCANQTGVGRSLAEDCTASASSPPRAEVHPGCSNDTSCRDVAMTRAWGGALIL